MLSPGRERVTLAGLPPPTQAPTLANLLTRSKRSEQNAHALADPGRLRVRVKLDDALERADVVELERFLND